MNELMKNLMKKKFIKFLKENNVYERFMYNFEHREERFYKYQKINFKTYFNGTHERCLLFSAFDWDSTSEGLRFWDEIDTKWVVYIIKNGKM